MTLAALLTFFSIVVAILALARPVGRRSLALFVPMWWIVAAVFLSLLCIIWRDAPLGLKPPFHWRLDLVEFGFTLGAFIIPVGVATLGAMRWYRAQLTSRNIHRVEGVVKASLRENEFDEIERIIRKNRDALNQLPASAAALLFHPKLVAALVASNSMLHLELLCNIQLIQSLDNPFGALDVVTRELLRSSVSPLRSAVVSQYGGLENLKYTDAERDLMQKTFLKPTWYRDTRADYSLVISAVEALARDKFDRVYNNVGRAYEATQGMSTRAKCPIYLATKTIVLALDAAIRQRVEGDFYVSELHDIFHTVLERSRYNTEVWESETANSEFPTPYAYLLYEIASDMHDLSCTAVQSATSENDSQPVAAPDRMAQDLAQCWSFCAWSIASSQKHVSADFRNSLISEYLKFVLELGWEPSEVYYGTTGHAVQGLDAWRDLFVAQLRQRFAGESGPRLDTLKDAVQSLDQGKMYVCDGYDWLEQKLFGKTEP
jgi:hypothetical protein